LLAFSELTAMKTGGGQSLALSKGIFIENKARTAGSAIAAGSARVALGDTLVARNGFSPTNPTGAAIEGAEIDLASSTIADNAAGGVKLAPAGQRARMVNVLVLRNASFGCSVPAGKQAAATATWQFPKSDCLGAPVRDPQLQSNYKPTTDSAVTHAGDRSLCMSEPLVGGLDLATTVRGNRGTCAIGAFEPDPRVDPLSDWSGNDHRWVPWILFLILLLFLLLGFLLAFCWSRRRCHGKKSEHAAA